ncbi:hypothetical protein PHPALM_28047 [Phytophthora palmivora]|uniref:Uncharacterized protein n=1 Tax=Phytophthora palmivora TaxID=4796 RepID=A0A2P4XB09_9STRA|nr:hypothetical protein PHPALM_28047 [Phytophthora palmivora]
MIPRQTGITRYTTITQDTSQAPQLRLSPTSIHIGVSVLRFVFRLRMSEYLADGAKEKSTTLLDRVQKIQIRLRGRKTDQFGGGTMKVTARSGFQQCCHVLPCQHMVQHHRSPGIMADPRHSL